MQKMIEFYYNKDIDKLKLGCTIPQLANICLHSSAKAIFIHSQKATKTCFQNFVKKKMEERQSRLHVQLL